VIQLFDITIKETLNERFQKLEAHFNADVIFYYGAIDGGLIKYFRDFIEKMKFLPPQGAGYHDSKRLS
jgi:hypothetical protein